MIKSSVDPSILRSLKRREDKYIHLSHRPCVLPLAYKKTEDFQDVCGYILDHNQTPWLQNVDPDLCIKIKITSGSHCYCYI